MIQTYAAEEIHFTAECTNLEKNVKQRKKSNFECTILPNGGEFGKNKTWVFSPIWSIR